MKIICIGMNYVLHKKELGHTEETPEPVIFLNLAFSRSSLFD